jgi:hypothetical protein
LAVNVRTGATGLSGTRLIAAILLVLVASRGLAREHQHGTGENMGAVHFPTSCDGAAQNDIDRAVALLHSFQFSRAIDDFTLALGKDGTCTIAYWGIALSDWGNPFAPGIILQTGQDQAAGRIVRSLPEMASRFDPKAALIGAGPQRVPKRKHCGRWSQQQKWK